MQILRNSQHPTESGRVVVGAGVGPGASTGRVIALLCFLHFLFIWCGCVLSWTDSSNMRQAAERCHFDWQLDKRTQNARARFSKRDRAAYATAAIEGSTDPKIRRSTYSEEHAPSQHRPTVSQVFVLILTSQWKSESKWKRTWKWELAGECDWKCEWEWEWESKSKSKSKWKRQRKCDLLWSSSDCWRFLLEIW